MMEGWKEVKIEEIADVVGGGTPSSKEDSYWNGDINWVTPADLSGYMFKHISSGERKITKLGLSKSSAKLHPKGTVLMTSRAPIGYLAIAGDEVATNQGFQSLRCKTDKVDNNFLYYILHVYKEGIQAIASGATFPEVSGKKVKGFKIKIPPLPTQRKIASILSAYDDLIENNLKRIKLLEEKAQLTYEEWFVRMKFPGHETAKFDEETGLPEGWEKGRLSDLIDYQSGFAYKSSKFTDDGFPVIKIKNIENNTIDTTNTNYIDQEYAIQTEKFKLQPGDLLIAMTGATVGKVGIVPITDKPCYLNQRVGRFLPLSDVDNTSFINCFFSLGIGLKHVLNIAGGAAQPNISAKQILGIETVIPKVELLKDFSELAINSTRSILNLQNQNKLLKEARDILLPRLMSGMVDPEKISGQVVEELNTDTLKPAH